jgi:hypothetical protein
MRDDSLLVCGDHMCERKDGLGVEQMLHRQLLLCFTGTSGAQNLTSSPTRRLDLPFCPSDFWFMAFFLSFPFASAAHLVPVCMCISCVSLVHVFCCL